MAVRPYGKTHEGRTLHYAVISHPDHIAHLDALRSASVRAADPRLAPADRGSEPNASRPVVVWIACSVHGDEASSTEAALALIWHLASARDAGVEAMLREVVVIVDPAQNPDGRERFVQYQRQVTTGPPRPDGLAVEHDQPWPGGRLNHLLFDLNRDWFFQTQPETRARVAAFLSWMPQVYVDLHEMSQESTYYFAPPAEPINRNVASQIHHWWNVFGRANAAAFDGEGLDYYTAETYDGYYPGYGDSWPSLHGAVGMTYEQASPRGSIVRRKDGSLVTLRDAARQHLIASLATIGAASRHRAEIIKDHAAARREAITAGEEGAVRCYIIPPTVPTAAARLAALLRSQGIEVTRALDEFSVRAQGYDGSTAKPRTFPAGTFLVSVAQPAGRLVTGLMEMDPEMNAEFIQEEMERRRLRQDSGIYDVTAWSLPVLMGVDASWTREAPRVRTRAVTEEDLVRHGQVIRLGPDAPPYAYLVKYDGVAAARTLVSLVRQDFKVRAAGRPFRIGEESFPAGSMMVRVKGNDASLSEAIRSEAATSGVDVYAAVSGLTDEGIDLGSASMRAVIPPRVAVAYGEPVSPTSLGAVLHLFESVYGLPYTPVRVSTLSGGDLSRYSVIVLPQEEGRPGYQAYFSGPGLASLVRWVEGGGTLITLGNATAFALKKETGLVSSRRVMKQGKQEKDEQPAAGSTGGRAEPPPGEPSDEPPDRVPGALLRVLMEPVRPLAFGYGREAAVLMNGDLVLGASDDARVVASYAPRERLRLAGFIPQESQDLLAGSPYLMEETRGRGRVIMFADDPGFRGACEALQRLFLNGILMSPSFGG